jgi:heme/copper-type cytochrome/quinol oxidase subunit 1
MTYRWVLMKLTKINVIFSIAFFILFLVILLVYFVIYIKLFIDADRINSSSQGSIEEYLSYETHEYKIINVTLKEEKFRARAYILECECDFKNEENKGTQKYDVHLIDDIVWVVTKMEKIKN